MLNRIKNNLFKIISLSALILFLLAGESFSQVIDTTLFNGLKYRNIGPFRGGRADAVTGVPGNRMLYYFGATGGGVWKTEDAGQTWENISDGFFGGSIGAVAVSEWDPNVIYVGTGEETLRGNVSSGNGVWKSVDAGKTWKHIGLEETKHISRIRIDPKNPDIIYVAAIGHLYGPNDQRGIFKSTDGGKNWKKVLFVNNKVGAADLVMDPANSRILYASTWKVKRTPYSFESGGEGSGLWKSTDSGETWKEITGNKGLPKSTMGIIGIAVSPANHNRIWALVEAHGGGLFRSDDAGETWLKINDEHKITQRAWYFSRIYADPKNEDVVYALNVEFWKSKDGGKTFEDIRTPHGDHHDLWINPKVPEDIIIADDGGAQITVNGGESWSTYHNQPTAQFYRVAVDDHFPYRIYGAQQDNSSIRIASRTDGGRIDESDWESTAGGESGWIVPDPKDNDVVYGGSYDGLIIKQNHKTNESRSVDVWPDNTMGWAAKDIKYRFQWNFPIQFSIHDKNTLYTAANVLFKTTNGGQSWQQISPDLTRNDTTKLGSSGGPITKDNTSVEYYCTIFTLAESPLKSGIIWTGSDDGLIYLTKDNGKTWNNVTPPKDLLPEWAQINSVEADQFNEGGLYVAATKYKSDDFHPYLLKTTDYGKSWERIENGIPADHFTRVIREDPKRKGLLYAGTEEGMYISFNDGEKWEPFQLNLPIVPVTDLVIKNNDLVVATQGRGFWILDDLNPLRQASEKVVDSKLWLYNPAPAYRMGGGSYGKSLTAGQNAPNGTIIHYYFKSLPDSNSVKLKILDNTGNVIETFSPDAKKKNRQMSFEKGINTFVWNMYYPDAEKFPGLILWFGGTRGPKAVPGKYKARLIVDKDSVTVPFEIIKDPRSSATQEDMQAQFAFIKSIRDKLTETHEAIKNIREARKQIKEIKERVKDIAGSEKIKSFADSLLASMKTIEERLYQTKNQSDEDPLNFPVRLNNRLSVVSSMSSIGDNKPTDQAIEVKREVTKLIDEQLDKLKVVFEKELPDFNKLVHEKNVPAVYLGKGKSAK